MSDSMRYPHDGDLRDAVQKRLGLAAHPSHRWIRPAGTKPGILYATGICYLRFQLILYAIITGNLTREKPEGGAGHGLPDCNHCCTMGGAAGLGG